MKLATRQLDSFVKKPPPNLAAALLYGPDDGLMRERSGILGRTVVASLEDPFNVSVLRGDQLVDDPARLSVEANALSMMGGKRLVRIEDAKDALAPMMKEYLKSPNANTLVIIEAGDLGKSSALRKLFDAAENAAPIPCYVEDERDIAALARAALQEQGYMIAPDAAGTLGSLVAGDRQQVRSELAKLMVFMGTNKQITVDDVLACCGDAGAQSFDTLVYSVAGRQPEEAFRAYTRLIEEGVSTIAIVRILQNHFRRLHLTKARIEAGESADIALKKLAPPVFFKYEQPFRAQLQRWSLPALEKILQRLSLLESQCKTSALPAETLCCQALLAISTAR